MRVSLSLLSMTVLNKEANNAAVIQRGPTISTSSSSSILDPLESLSLANTNRLKSDENITHRKIPRWAQEQIPTWGERICMPEWDVDESIEVENNSDLNDIVDSDYRSMSGWKGSDLCHSVQSPVRVSHYGVQYKEGGVGTKLTGLCHFTPASESHAGYCHGGSMTCVMDDIIGWLGFNVSGECVPWSGFTAQVNTCLKAPIEVNSYLKIEGIITKWEGRKVWIHSKLVSVGGEANEEDDDIVHCTAEGLVILKRTDA